MTSSRRRPILLAVAAGLALAGCGQGSGGPDPHATTAPPTTPAATTTTVPVATTAPTTTVYRPTAAAGSPDAAASALVSAWAAGNRAAAGAVADPAAVVTLFAQPYPTGYLQSRGCTLADVNPGTCTYRNTDTDGIYEVTVTDGPAGWYVSAVTVED